MPTNLRKIADLDYSKIITFTFLPVQFRYFQLLNIH